jgi:acetoin utilization protein AcuC
LTSTALVWDERLASYSFGPDHPLNPRRLELTLSLCRALGLLDESVPVLQPRPATEEELELVHAPEFIQIVKQLSIPGADPRPGLKYGLGTDDVPIVPGMHEAASLIAGATLVAAEAVMSGRVKRAFSVAGGLHHARRAEAAGFCIYSDLAVGIEWMKRTHGVRVMYIDYDAHHGDGVQQIFYEDPEVLKVSFHESGTYLFPGTGFVDELGVGEGYGYSVNVPLDAHTEDASFRQCFDELVPQLAEAFRPDVIVLQNGCDSHVLDPLTHLRCTTGLYEQLVRTVCEVADQFCGGRIVATGGGGYAIYTVVPRAWSLVFAALRGVTVPDPIPSDWLHAVEREAGAGDWLHELRIAPGTHVPVTLRDAPDVFPPAPRRTSITETNDKTMRAVRQRVLPLLTGWGLAF